MKDWFKVHDWFCILNWIDSIFFKDYLKNIGGKANINVMMQYYINRANKLSLQKPNLIFFQKVFTVDPGMVFI